eukprot:tig00000042_g15519.t1
MAKCVGRIGRGLHRPRCDCDCYPGPRRADARGHGAFESTPLGGWHTEPSYVVAGATGRVLKPYIRRDSETRPRHVALLEELVATARRLGTARDVAGPYQRAPIDYCHLQPHLVPQANRLLSEVLWPNIDTSDHEAAAAFPELTAVALYRKRVIGCAVMTNRGYVLYPGVDLHWRRSGAASFLLYSILQASRTDNGFH